MTIANFFKKKKIENKEKNYVLICSLLVHAAKMDENYTNREKQIILKALSKISTENQENLNMILLDAEKKENESNQILEFTKEIKKYEKNFRLKIIEILWKIIYSDNIVDMYESNLMRRLSGLLYLDNKIVGDIKEKIKKNLIK